MTTPVEPSPATVAAQAALADVFAALDSGQNFRLEAGAGAGKTYTLVKALQYLIDKRGAALLRHGQQVACITYTNVATDEIIRRTDRHPVVFAATIHSFCWSLIRPFQAQLRKRLSVDPKWRERSERPEGGAIAGVEYDLGYPRVTKGRASLGHHDVLTLMVDLMKEAKFRRILASRFPVVFIDEYQDTNQLVAGALAAHFVETQTGPQLGFFGDHWQKIYGDGCGTMEHPSLRVIGKKANFRSAPAIVDVLNRLRPELTQAVSDVGMKGSVVVYHTNGYRGARQTRGHWKGDLPAVVAHEHLNQVRTLLGEQGWVFSPESTKILMLTHNVLAQEQGYQGIANALVDGDLFAKKEDPYIEFLVDVVEPVCRAYETRRYGEMLSILGRAAPKINSIEDKRRWAREMGALLAHRARGTIGDVIDCIRSAEGLRLPARVEERERRLSAQAADLTPQQAKAVDRTRNLRAVAYKEIAPLSQFIDEHTMFSTKHGVKGAEFENVLVVMGRGWNLYDFNAMLEWLRVGVPADKSDAFERNRNLFYVACSRPKRRLALLFTQELSSEALASLGTLFGTDRVVELPTA